MSRTALIILGATGDLAKRKLMPGLAHLCIEKKIDENTVVIGSGRTVMTEEAFRSRFDLPPKLRKRVLYHAGITGLKSFVGQLGAFDKVVVFCALPPSTYTETAKALSREGFGSETALIIEKPFGQDLASAQQLNHELVRFFPEKNIFRIDHYLAKEAVRNLMVFRFANPIFRRSWDRQSIESVHISALETVGTEGRAGYFDQAGTLRDMVQNHLIQMLSFTLMDPPRARTPEAVVESKLALLQSLTVVKCCRAQYQGYREEDGVPAESNTETYTELELSVRNEQWFGCPIYIRAGKACAEAGAEIVVTFKAEGVGPFSQMQDLPKNRIVIKIQPAAGVILDLATRFPGSEDQVERTALNFCYADVFTHSWMDGYEKLLLDAVRGDHSLFVSSEEAEAAWRVVDPVVGQGPLATYERGLTPHLLSEVEWPVFGNYCQNPYPSAALRVRKARDGEYGSEEVKG